jgi:hypothetical protein
VGPAYFVIAILGCADGGTACTPITTVESRYATQDECVAATGAALVENSDFDFPTLVARCRPEAGRKGADATDIRNEPRSRPGR